MIYLDNAATTKVAPEVLDTMLPYFSEQYGNAGTIYGFGLSARAAMDKAREQTARLFSCPPTNVIFTSGGSEGNNMIIKGLRRHLLESGKTHIILSATEHDSVLHAAQTLTKDGFYLTLVKPGQDGSISAEIVEKEIRPDTGFVSIMYANNETGAVNDIEAIGLLCERRSILFHSDCVQAAGQFSIDVDKLNLDFATVSSHKIHGPKGVGAIFARDPDLLEPLINGGSEQEFGLRGGTENVPGVVGFGKACELAVDNMKENMIAVTSNKQFFVRSLLDDLPYDSLQEAGIHYNGYTYIDPGKVVNLRIDNVSGDTLVLMMGAFGVCISAGSACRSHEAEPSHVLLANGLTPDEARSSVRISFSKYDTQEELREAARIMANCIETLRASTPPED